MEANLSNRAHVLKQMLEGYLSQTPKPMPDLQEEANQLARDAMSQLQAADGDTTKSNNNTAAPAETNGDSQAPLSSNRTQVPLRPQ